MNATPRFIIATFFCLALLSGCASQKEVVILDERMMILERQNRDLQQKNESLQRMLNAEIERVGKTSQSSQTNLLGQYASVNADIETLRQEVRMLSGRIEEFSHLVQQKSEGNRIEELNQVTAKLNQRLAEIERYLNLESSRTGAAGSPAPPSAEALRPPSAGAASSEGLYAAAKQAFDNGQMEPARRQFEEFIKTYPNAEGASSAQFWVAETYYREKWYEKAILEYQTVIEKYPKGNKVPAAMFKQGMSFLQLGDKANAALIWKQLEKKYPGSNEAKMAAAKLKEQ